jgi:23S rRNA (cytosine1962-C5)-methyltransferase
MNSDLPSIRLQPGRDKRVAFGHPWAFSNELAMDQATKALPPGSLVRLLRTDGKPFGTATFNVASLIAARLLARDDRPIDTGFFVTRLRSALALREKLFPSPHYRLIHAEADGLPGLVLDRYGDVLVAQVNTAGMERLQPLWLEALDAVLAPRAVVLRNDSSVRTLENLPLEVITAKGTLAGPVELQENGVTFLAEPLGGQKTGYFFDLGPARRFMADLAKGGTMLDMYCHTGAFGVQAAVAGARHVTMMDRSETALALARASAERNGVSARTDFASGDAFAKLEALGAEGARFDVVVVDPPSFVKRAKELASGIKGYRKLARLAAPLVNRGGFLFIASCSHNVPVEGFADEVRRGLHAAGREGRIIASGGAGPDHPTHPWLPESAYLKWQVLTLD